MYVEGNPVNLVDPSGMMACTKSNDPECITLINELKVEAQHIHIAVKQGILLPVEGFAQFADSASNKFNQNIRGTLWAMTLIINGFDANSFVPISYQAYIGGSNYPSQFFGFDWLPYNDAACDDVESYYESGVAWICSERGDWKVEYWDKTANQAYHGWFFSAATFFDGRGVATIANLWHEVAEGPFEPIPVNGPPPVSGITVEDYALSLKMMELGSTLYFRQRYFDQLLGTCPPPNSVLTSNLKNLSIGSWIRSNLKDYSVR